MSTKTKYPTGLELITRLHPLPLLRRVNRTTLIAYSSPTRPSCSSTMPWPRRSSKVGCRPTQSSRFPPGVALNALFLCLDVYRCSGRLQRDNICLWADVLGQNSHNGGNAMLPCFPPGKASGALRFFSALFILYFP